MINPRGTFRAGFEAFGNKGQHFGRLAGRPHVHRHTAVRPHFGLDDGLHRLNTNARLVGEPLFTNKDGETAGAIAALFDLVPVAVEDAIAEINTGKPGTLDHQHLISPNAEATVGQIADECRRRLDVLSDAVKHHEVIAGTLHFRKLQRSHFRYSFQSFLIEVES